MEYISGSSVIIKEFAFSKVVGNIVIFIPLGIIFVIIQK